MTKFCVFCASIATETNTFSPLRTDIADFEQSLYARPGDHPETPTLCTAVFPSLRARARAGEIELIEGTAAWAEPGGLLNRETWLQLKAEVLDQLRLALPVDAVVLGLHGAMIADGSVDCEGELLEAARRIAGPDAVIGATFDPHSHLSDRRVANADIITVFKEFPHTDFAETGEACVDLTLRALRCEIAPAISVYDVRMIDVLPTSLHPMRGFVDKMIRMETQGQALSVSAIHGFMAGNSPDLGAKIIVITDNDRTTGDKLARVLGEELYSFRGRAAPEFLSATEALKQAQHISRTARKPVVVADVWDNPGGGVAGDSTIIAEIVLQLGLRDVAIGTIWDPMAVRLCRAAGEGATLDLRFGGKTSAHAGNPIDAQVTVTRIVPDAVQRFGTAVFPLGDCAAIDIDGLQIVLNTNRSQAFSPDLFTNAGIDITKKKILIVKSTNHFHGAFAPVASEILYAAVDGPYPNNPRKNNYTRLTRKIWPMTEPIHEETYA